ncbi:NUDIX hydrolase [Consotaella aegiceratis]|uniref:NUDIX hydrolase n=1 Tax=Consotaella aegiceratis TaxID=3097961 RepID=UPI002F3FAFF3
MIARAPLLGVSVCLFRAEKVLLVERGRPPALGLLSLPGGKVRFGERLEEALRREVMEETGLDVARFAFVCLHEAISPEDGTHAVIAVYRGAQGLPVDAVPVAGDDARAVGFHSLAGIEELERDDKLTPGLVKIVRSAHRAHLAGL